MNPEDISAVSEQEAAPMPPIYICKTELTAALQQEASEALTPRYLRYLIYIAFAVSMVMGGLLLYAFFVGKVVLNLVLAALVLVVGAYLLYNHFSMPKRLLVQWEERMNRSYGTSCLHLTTEFYRFSLAQTMQEADELRVENYADLTALVESEHLLLLKKGRGSWFFIAKDGLQSCDVDTLRSFISERIGGK